MTTALPGYGTHIPDELLLGHIAWYTITKPQVSHQELVDLTADLKLSPSIIPKPPRLGDAFKRACRYSERKGLVIPLSDNRANFLIRSVAQTLDEIERHLVLEIVDAEGRHLEYQDAAKLNFKRDEGVLHVRKRTMPNDLDPMVMETLSMFNANFEEATKTIDAQVIRRMIREQLDVMRAVAIRRKGSVYFIPIAEKDATNALEEFCTHMGSGSVFNSVPLPDTTKQREMVKNAFEDEVHEEATQMIVELRRKQESGEKITALAWEKYRNKYNALKEGYGEYGTMIETEMTKAEYEIQALEMQLTDFLSDGMVKT